MSRPVPLSPLQIRLLDDIVALLRGAGLEPKVRRKRTRAEPPDEGSAAAPEATGAESAPEAGASSAEQGAGVGTGATGAGPAGAEGSGRPGAPETTFDHELVIRWELGGLRFEVWLYPDAAGVAEPGDDWWPFDAGDFEGPEQLREAVLEHIRDILAEAAESGG